MKSAKLWHSLKEIAQRSFAAFAQNCSDEQRERNGSDRDKFYTLRDAKITNATYDYNRTLRPSSM